MLLCKTCKLELSEDLFYYRKDTGRYHTSCKKCQCKTQWERQKTGLVKKRIEFDFICKTCDTPKKPDDFYMKDKKTARYDTTCKECRKNQTNKWHKDNHDQSLRNKTLWYQRNRAKMLTNMRENYNRRMRENPERERETRRKWMEANSEYYKAHMRKRYATDVNFKLGARLRGNCWRIVKKGCKKHCRTLDMLGCSVDFVRKWLESQFTSEMSWENYGTYWHIDHFYPVACFDLSKDSEQDTCFNWANLQPLEGCKNMSKGAKLPAEEESEQHLEKVIDFYLSNREEKSVLRLHEGIVDDKQLDSLLESDASPAEVI